MKRFARGNRFPAEERAIYHKSLARDSPFPRLKGELRPIIFLGRGNVVFLSIWPNEKVYVHVRFNEEEKKGNEEISAS